MEALANDRAERFALTSAALRFLVAGSPPSEHTIDALATFVDEAAACRVRPIELEAVLIRCLSVLDQRSGRCSPGLVAHYMSRGAQCTNRLARFRQCVEAMLEALGIGDPYVQRAVALIHRDCAHLKTRDIAAAVGLERADLATRFNNRTGFTIGEYLRDVRLQRAASLLTTSDKRIKDVWVEVGYNHPSNFDHEFRRKFGVSPREYRRRSQVAAGPRDSPVSSDDGRRDDRLLKTVLLVDDDEGTRDTIGRHLGLHGYHVVVAPTGHEGVRQAELQKPAFVLLDYHLPDIDGVTCLRLLRSRDGSEQMKVVLFTADIDLEISEIELNALDARVVWKLCDLDDVLALVAAS